VEGRLDDRVVGQCPEQVDQRLPVASRVLAGQQPSRALAGFDQLGIERVVELPRKHPLARRHERTVLSAS
jgi:hypothetical protein